LLYQPRNCWTLIGTFKDLDDMLSYLLLIEFKLRPVYKSKISQYLALNIKKSDLIRQPKKLKGDRIRLRKPKLSAFPNYSKISLLLYTDVFNCFLLTLRVSTSFDVDSKIFVFDAKLNNEQNRSNWCHLRYSCRPGNDIK
jgi:hypothetical protein